MNKKRLLKHLVYLMFFMFLANFAALQFYWYSSIWYFDIIMHFLGGLWVGMFFLYVFSRHEVPELDFKFLLQVLLSALIVGLLWEIYEFYVYQYISQIPFSREDTVADIFFDLFGATVSCFYFSKLIISDYASR